MQVIEDLRARGHSNILATHPTTFEITKDPRLTKRGNCVIAVEANRSLADLSPEFKRMCRHGEAQITVEFKAAGIAESIFGSGSSELTLGHLSEIVGRRSTYVSDRTLMIRADRAASDIRRDLVRELKSPNTRVEVRLIAELF